MELSNVIEFCEAIDSELALREQAGDLSLLAAGGSFEQWLSFEARIQLERNRERLGVEDSWWTANEFKKVDLGVWAGDGRLVVQMECKLVHNNKNWQAQVDSAWADLFPAGRSQKHRLQPRLRAAIVGVVGKVYDRPGSAYPGQCSDLAEWERELWKYAIPPVDDAYHGWVQRAWHGARHSLQSRALADGPDHFFQLNLLAPMRTE